jgi:hypothetical protein
MRQQPFSSSSSSSLSLSLSPIPSHKARTRESSEVGGCSALLCCDQLEIFSTDVKIETKQQSALLMFPPSKRKENQAVKLLFLFLSTSLSFPIRKK